MAIDNFNFKSPGVYINEIDESTLPTSPEGVGPVIIGLAQKGPAMIPVKVNSKLEFLRTFGAPLFGTETEEDSWREGNKSYPTYASLAAVSALQNGTPVTFIRTLGVQDISPNTSGYAGWKASAGAAPSATVSSNKLAYGIFAAPSASLSSTTGSLVAIVYTNEASLGLKLGADYKAGKWVGPLSGTGGKGFELVISSSNAAEKIEFSLDKDSKKFLRRVLNTNASALDATTNETPKKYFLGESFEDVVTYSGDQALAVVPLYSGSYDGGKFSRSAAKSETGYFVSQDFGAYAGFASSPPNSLFKLVSLTEGEWNQSNIKVSIENIKLSTNDFYPYGTFDVVIRPLFDTTGEALEVFSNLSLDPESDNFISKAIGDKYMTWNEDAGVFDENGSYDNVSKYVYVQLHTDFNNINQASVPFGVYLPQSYSSVTATTASVSSTIFSGSSVYALQDATGGIGHSSATSVLLQFPSVPLTLTGSKKSTWGVEAVTGSQYVKTAKKSLVDIVRVKPEAAPVSSQVLFSLDNLSGSSVSGTLYYSAGSRVGGTSYTAQSGSSVETLLTYQNSFQTVLAGGFDGLDILKTNPLTDTVIGTATDEKDSYVLKTLNRAITAVSDREVVACNMLAIPGIGKEIVTDKLVNVAQTRGDCIALIDILGAHVPATENKTTSTLSVASARSSIRTRKVNTSYAATFYPWVKVRNTNGTIIPVPATVAAIASFARSDRLAGNVWYAPAGFTRGRLDVGVNELGINIVDVVKRLSVTDRDSLYEVNVNPIARLPEGIVLFGQKTLQLTPSALDRINVRRLLNYVKREVSFMASTTLFDPNTEVTWKRFTDRADPFLQGIVSGQGLAEYRLVLDNTTTTPDLVDRNIIYAKVLLKPTRAAEFFAIDFTIVRTDATL